MGRFHVTAPVVIFDQGALLTLTVYVAGDEVHLVAAGVEVAHPGHLAVPTDRIDNPDFPDLWKPLAGLEDVLDAFEFDEDEPAVLRDGEA